MSTTAEQLRNVSFGGPWVEKRLGMAEHRRVFNILSLAIDIAEERDPRSPELNEALDYVRNYIEKGPMLAAGFERAMRLATQEQRRLAMEHYLDKIEQWAGE